MRRDHHCCYKTKPQFSLHSWQNFSLSIMTTLRNKRKLAAVSRETPENTRNSQSQNTLDPEMAQEYISHVSEEIEERVTKKLSKEFSRTESRILGALSKLDEFLPSPQVRTCSVAVPGTSRNNESENREPTGGSFLKWSLSRSGVLFQSLWQSKLLKAGRVRWQLRSQKLRAQNPE